MEKLEKIVKFKPAFDKRHSDPKRNYGIGSIMCFMILRSNELVVHFVFSTGIFLPETIKEYHQDGKDLFHYSHNGKQSYYMGFDVGYHTLKPQFDGQGISQKKCEWLNEKPCYCDGSALTAEKYMDILVRKGSDKIWKLLEENYKYHYKNLISPQEDK